MATNLTRHFNNFLSFTILQRVISSQTPLFLLVFLPSLLPSTFPIHPKSRRSTRTSDSLPSSAIWQRPPRRPSRTVSTWTLPPFYQWPLFSPTPSIPVLTLIKVGDQGLTIPLPSSSKRPKITSIDRWLDALAMYFPVIVSVYPSLAADLTA